MFLGGTIVLSIAASFFGATGIMGLKYIQNDCYDEVELYFKNPVAYLALPKEYAIEDLDSTWTKPTKEFFYEKYGEQMIGEPYVFSEESDANTYLYVYSGTYRTMEYSRAKLLQIKVKTAVLLYNDEGQVTGFNTDTTDTTCFESVGGFGEIEGVLTCGIRYSQPEQKYGSYEESKKTIVGREQCAVKEDQIKCDEGSPSFPLCCEQFENKYTWSEGCACINSPDDASCKFDKSVDCTYRLNTLNFAKTEELDYYCNAISSTTGWCEKNGNNAYSYADTCKDAGSSDQIYTCCQQADVWGLKKTRHWRKWGQPMEMDMIPTACQQFNECNTGSDFFSGCCKDFNHPDCKICTTAPTTLIEEDAHASLCGYNKCDTFSNKQKEISCCSEIQAIFDITFPANTACKTALDYNPCDSSNSLACNTVTNDCNKSKDCFPNCCAGKNFDFATTDTIKLSVESDCFQEASELIGEIHDKDHLLGHYIYHKTGIQGSQRPSCKQVNGIIDPKCCNEDYDYGPEDPCYCHRSDTTCINIHHSKCLPDSDQYPQCCYDIGDFFSDDHFCKCRLKENLTGEAQACNEVNTSNPSFDLIDICPNPCRNDKALINAESLICELPVFNL